MDGKKEKGNSGSIPMRRYESLALLEHNGKRALVMVDPTQPEVALVEIDRIIYPCKAA